MTKEEQIKFLYHQLDVCGQILAEWDYNEEPTEYRKEYRSIIYALKRLEPEKWKDFRFSNREYSKRDAAVAKFLKENPCPHCGGERKHLRSGTYTIYCPSCKLKWKLTHN